MHPRLIQTLPDDVLATRFYHPTADVITLLHKRLVAHPLGIVVEIQVRVAADLALGFIARTPRLDLCQHSVELTALQLGLTRFLPGLAFGTLFAEARLRIGGEM